MASDTRTIDTFVAGIQGIAAGFQIAQGAAALFGDENEDLQKAMLKVQGAMALANGVQQVANLLQKESILMTQGAAAAQKLYALAVGTSTGALRAFRIALAATGIGAVVVALGLAAEAMGFFTSKTKDNTKAQEDNKRALDETVGTMEYYDRKLKANGATEADLAKIRLKALNAEKSELDRKLADDIARYGVKNDSYQNSLRNELDLLDTKIKEENQIIAADAKAKTDAEAARNKAAAEKLKKQREDDFEKRKQELRDLAKFLEDTRLMIFEQELADQSRTEQTQIDAMRKEGARRKKQAQDNVDIAKRAAENEIKIREEVVKSNVDISKSGFQTIGELANAFAGQSEASQKRAFAVNKAANIAAALIDTYAAAQGAFKSQMTVPDPSAPIRAKIAAGIAIAAGLARVAAIAKTQFKSTSAGTPPPSPSGGGGGGEAAPASIFANPQTTNLGTGELSAGQGQQTNPMRAYVVERDIEQTSRRVRRLEEFATLS
jgi:hypothetical protein